MRLAYTADHLPVGSDLRNTVHDEKYGGQRSVKNLRKRGREY